MLYTAHDGSKQQMGIRLGPSLLYMLSTTLCREGFPAENFTAKLQGPRAAFQTQRFSAAVLQIGKARHEGHLHPGRLRFGTRATCRHQGEEAEFKVPFM